MYLTLIAQRIREALPAGVKVPDDSDSLFLLYALLATATGTNTTLCDIHNAWAIWQVSKNPSHRALVPFEKLTVGKREEDKPFLEATLRVAGEIASES